MQWVGRLGALEWLGFAQSHPMTLDVLPLDNWKWLSVVAKELGRAKGGLSHLKYVRLCCNFTGGWVPFLRTRRVDGIAQGDEQEEGELYVEELSPLILWNFIAALPSSVTTLHLGPEGANEAESWVLKPHTFITLLRMLERGTLPQLRKLICPVELDARVLDALASALTHGPCAATLKTLVLADASGKEVPPSDLTSLIAALAHCPNLRKLALGPGQCEARHFSAFMDLVIAGTLPQVTRMPLWVDLPVRFTSEGEMDAAVCKLIEALDVGRLRDTDSLMLGDTASHVPLAAATLRRFLAATRHMDLPHLYHLGLKAHMDPETPRLLFDWIVGRPELKYLSLTLVGGAVQRGSAGEEAILDLIKHCAEKGERLLLSWEIAGAESRDDHTGGAMRSPTSAVPSKRCCVLQGLKVLLDSCRPPQPGSVVEISFAWVPTCDETSCRKEDPHKHFCRCKAPSSAVVNLRHMPEEDLCWSKEAYMASGGQGIDLSLQLHVDWLREEVLSKLTERRLALRACGKVETISITFSPEPSA